MNIERWIDGYVVNVLADYNKLCIWVTIPEGVWQAWRDYSDKYYTEGR